MKAGAGRVKTLSVAIMMAALAGLMFYQFLQTPPQTKSKLEKCTDLLQGCKIVLNGQNLVVKFSEPPSALKPFMITMTASEMQSVYADFKMEGMEMGPTKYRLKQVQKNAWEAKVILPVCVAGRRDWMLILELDQRMVFIPFST
ncbi:hypothetical protein [Sulfurirhabdus autotrophica]|uniref:Uncharacterized protein n=1 Tax=Sulfurirhabdus autotrophica TaxID=1706046 RepID=A0A4R3XTK7_9PROT|nr:hypothetical protein [Sulfurirhabdus autotrophica]TCV83005.1 hypothetical protein EDC63_11740 [Sulfurirhabdus autotrophica]